MKSKFFLSVILVVGMLLPQTRSATSAIMVPTVPANLNSISGRVTDDSGNGLEGVTIRAVLNNYQFYFPQVVRAGSTGTPTVTNPPDFGQNFYELQTDTNGNYSFDNVPQGRYVLTADKLGQDFSPLSYTVNSSPGGSNYNFQVITIPTVYTPTTNVLTSTTTSQLVSISSDGSIYTFGADTPELAQINAGEVIIGGISTAAPEGFLRKVISKQQDGSNIELVTEKATLLDAFESLSVNMTQQLTPTDVKSILDIPGIKLLQEPNGIQTADFQFAMDNAVLYDQDHDLSTTGDQIIANGILSVQPNIELRIRIENLTLEEFYFTSTMSVQTGFTVSAKASLDLLSYEHSFIPTPITLGAFPVGPIIVTPELDLIGGISGSLSEGITASITNTTSFTAGAQLLNGQWQNLSKFQNNFSFTPISFEKSVSFEAFVGPKLSIKIFDVLGPYVKPGFALKLDITPSADPWLALKGGFEVSVGVSITIPIIEYDIVDLQFTPIDYWYLLYSLSKSSNNQPNPASNPSPPQSAANQSLSTQLSWIGGDPDGDAVAYDVYFDAGNSPPTTKVANHQSGTTFNPGPLTSRTTYYWKIDSFDQHGLLATGPVWNFTTVTNSPPNIPSNPWPITETTGQSLNINLMWTGGDPENDAVAYDVYFEAGNSLPAVKVANHQSGTAFNPGPLIKETQYYWKVVAFDESGLSTEGPVWSFSTGDGSIHPGDMILIPAGTFLMGCDYPLDSWCNSWWGMPRHTVYLDAYRIDQTEVTNGLYAQCVASGSCTAPNLSTSYSRLSYFDNPAYANYPVVNVTWYNATNYCTWAGKRLPTEAEWEKAARGSSDTREYPWGDQAPSCNLANGYYFKDGSEEYAFCQGDTTEVGSYPLGASPYGVLDTSGNVNEWVNDWFQIGYYSTGPNINPPGPASGIYKILRGGNMFEGPGSLDVTYKNVNVTPEFSRYDIGFRCAATP